MAAQDRYQIRNDPEDEAHQAELIRCRDDIVYWVNTYCWTYDPREAMLGNDPNLRFHLFPRQAEFLLWLQEREAEQKGGVAEKSRDVGFTWLCCAYAVHGWLFRKGFSAGFGSRKLDLVDKKGDPKCIFEKIRFLVDHLPPWMLPVGYNRNKHANYCQLENPANGATITGEGGDQIGRGGRNSIYFIDEAAFLLHPKLADAALSATSRVKIWVSTPNGPGNTFAQKRFGGNFAVFTFYWRDDPRKDDAWRALQDIELDPVQVAQEVEIDYSASVEGICIPAKFVRAAVGFVLPGSGEPVGGLDIADGGRNKTVMVARRGPLVFHVWDSRLEAMQAIYAARDEAIRIGLRQLNYDAIGVGTNAKGIFNLSTVRLPFATNAILGGEPASETRWPDGRTSKERFTNYRAELWWLLRTRFEKTYEVVVLGRQHPAEELISIPNHPQLIADLSLPLCFHTDTGKLQLESKKDMLKRGVASPDYGDALAYSFVQVSWFQDPKLMEWLKNR